MFDRLAHGNVKEVPRMVYIMASCLGRTREILERFGRAPAFDGTADLAPYVEALESVAGERYIEQSGVDALRMVADIWDQRTNDFVNGRSSPLSFSPQEEKTIQEALSDYYSWLRIHFPEYGGHGPWR